MANKKVKAICGCCGKELEAEKKAFLLARVNLTKSRSSSCVPRDGQLRVQYFGGNHSNKAICDDCYKTKIAPLFEGDLK